MTHYILLKIKCIAKNYTNNYGYVDNNNNDDNDDFDNNWLLTINTKKIPLSFHITFYFNFPKAAAITSKVLLEIIVSAYDPKEAIMNPCPLELLIMFAKSRGSGSGSALAVMGPTMT